MKRPPPDRFAPVAPTAATLPRIDTDDAGGDRIGPARAEQPEAVDLEAGRAPREHEHAPRPAGARRPDPDFAIVGGQRGGKTIAASAGRRRESRHFDPGEIAAGGRSSRGRGRVGAGTFAPAAAAPAPRPRPPCVTFRNT